MCGFLHIILHMRKVSSGHMLSIEIFYSLQLFCMQTATVLIGCAGRSALCKKMSIFLEVNAVAESNKSPIIINVISDTNVSHPGLNILPQNQALLCLMLFNITSRKGTFFLLKVLVIF